VIQQCRIKSSDGADNGLVTGQMTSKQALQVGQSVVNAVIKSV